jgi:hypothetical protein
MKKTKLALTAACIMSALSGLKQVSYAIRDQVEYNLFSSFPNDTISKLYSSTGLRLPENMNESQFLEVVRDRFRLSIFKEWNNACWFFLISALLIYVFCRLKKTDGVTADKSAELTPADQMLP